MNRKTEEGTEQNIVLVKGEIDKLKLDRSGALSKLVFHPQSLSRSKSRFGALNPVKIYTQDTSLAIIDQNDEGWLMIEQYDFPVNLSELAKTKFLDIYLGEKELIARTKKERILINWGTKKLLDKEALSKVSLSPPFNSNSLFEVFTIHHFAPQDIYRYCPEPKVDNYNRLYHFDSQNSRIVGYPTRDSIPVSTPIKGISVGELHCLCWDQQGFLYSWGGRTLGLGYVSLPSEEYVEHPQPVKISKKVLTAVAGTHYSLALTEEGTIYEWGIKKDVNQINEEPIFKPRPLQFKYFRCQAKFISLKGRENNFAALSSTNQLYVWGATAKKLISNQLELPTIWKGNYLFEPVLQTQFANYQIQDFSIDSGYLAVIVGDHCEPFGDQDYWKLLKLKARKQLEGLKKIRVTTESQEVLTLKKKYQNPLLSAIEKEPKKKLTQKMRPINCSANGDHPNFQKNHSERTLIQEKFGHFKKTAPASSTVEPLWQHNSIRHHKRQVSEVPALSPSFAKLASQDLNNWRASETSSGTDKVGEKVSRRQKFSQIYQLRLRGIMEKKKHQEENALSNYMQKIAEDSMEFRLKKKEEHLQRKKVVEEEKLLKSTLKKTLVSQYLASFFMGAADEAREVKIKHFFRGLVLQRVERNIRNLFVAKKIQYSLNNLKELSAGRYLTLHFCIRRYVSRFRKRRFERCRKLAVSTLTKNAVLSKVKTGLDFIKQKKSQLTKVNEWLKNYERQRKQCLREVWNNFITLTFKIKEGGEYYFSPSDPENTFQKLWKAKLKANPLLKLRNYMRFTTPFLSLREIKFSSPIKQGKRRGHKMQEERVKNGYPTEILPFSLHYSYFRRPKNYDVNVGEASRVSPFWVETQRKTLEEHLGKILYYHNQDYVFSRRQYEVALACYIAANYQTFYEKRWKFILEYNKVEKTQKKKKTEVELRRLLGLIGMTKLLDNDCIPEKQMVLEEALKRKDVPTPPDPVMHFNLPTFEESFKTYVEQLRGKMKVGKKSY